MSAPCDRKRKRIAITTAQVTVINFTLCQMFAVRRIVPVWGRTVRVWAGSVPVWAY
jgi:hypothetical protein